MRKIFTLSELLKRAESVRKYRDALQRQLTANAEALQQAAFAQVLDWLDRHPDATLPELSQRLSERVVLPRAQAEQLRVNLEAAQQRILTLRARLYDEAGVSLLGSTRVERLSALYRVDFPKIEQQTNKLIQLVLRQAQVSDLPASRTVYAALRQSGKVRHQAATLANTALAQFDNAYTVELARSGAVDVMEYAGPPPQRLFCGQHLGKQYTIPEIELLNNGQGLPVLTSCGGYNCRHSWIAVPPFLLAR